MKFSPLTYHMVVAIPKKYVSRKTKAHEDGIMPPRASKLLPVTLSTKQETEDVEPIMTPTL